jgi:hypothetical protein
MRHVSRFSDWWSSMAWYCFQPLFSESWIVSQKPSSPWWPNHWSLWSWPWETEGSLTWPPPRQSDGTVDAQASPGIYQGTSIEAATVLACEMILPWPSHDWGPWHGSNSFKTQFKGQHRAGLEVSWAHDWDGWIPAMESGAFEQMIMLSSWVWWISPGATITNSVWFQPLWGVISSSSKHEFSTLS